MTLLAKLARPLPTSQIYSPYLISRVHKDPVTFFCAPSGYISTGSLSAALSERATDTVWCRLDPGDGDPGVLLVTLIDGLRKRSPGAGSATLERMREQPGPINGWPPLFAQLAREMGELPDGPGALVLENIHNTNSGSQSLPLLTTHFIPLLPERTRCILISHVNLPKKELPAQAPTLGPAELRQVGITPYAPRPGNLVNLPRRSLQRLSGLMQGQASAVESILSAGEWLGAEALEQHIIRAGSGDNLLERIARHCLDGAQPAEVAALAVCIRLEYYHPEMTRRVLAGVQPPDGPWWQELEGGWRRIMRFWQAPLRQALRSAATAPGDALERAAEYFAGQYAVERAVGLYLELGKPSEAAQCMNAAAGAMINQGQWQTLQGWLSRLPAAVLNRWPRLVYAGVEMMVARGDTASARRAFATATRLFEAQQDLVGMCQSLLAESTLAFKENDLRGARERAAQALRCAVDGQFPWFVVWAAWHLGCLALLEDDLAQALVSFSQARAAADTLGDATAIALTLQVEALVRQQHNLAQERERHRQAYFLLEQYERETAERLRYMLMDTPANLNALLRVHGWSSVPLNLKMQPALPLKPVEREVKPPAGGLLARLRELAGIPGRAPDITPVVPEPPFVSGIPLEQPGAASVEQHTTPKPSVGIIPVLAESAPAQPAPGVEPAQEQPAPAQPILTEEPHQQPALTAHLLGPFHAQWNDQPIENLPRGQGRSLFKYLLVHRERPTPREVLMETFWPGAAPESARNSLNVALHNLRKALGSIGEEGLVLFQEGAYQMNPAFCYWLDAEEFERMVQVGSKARRDGDLEAEAASFGVCASLYQGEFLEDEPYEDWPVLTRERLRLAYLEALDRLSQISYSRKQYSASAELSLRLLERDDCREDAHCRLMRCYVQQGQYHLAIRQYKACEETLLRELGVEPALSTRQLYEQILKREPV